ncbi:MAG TPA: rhomboid family intramembrane serine protease, partial [Chthoniobacterales bacterium]|nr:rhomboid family intramembrane serine protease [Chthoniobacterales bacterium]
MIDLNHILLFIACISPLVMLGQTLRRGGLFRPWRLASLAVLLVTGTAWLIHRDTAGFVGGGAWLTLLFIPAIGTRKMSELCNFQEYKSARRWATLLRVVHPSTSMRGQARLLTALEMAQAGDSAGALNLLASLRNNQTNVGRQAIAQTYRLKGEWGNLAGWIRTDVPPAVRRHDFALRPLYLRALGETGDRDELVLELATMLSATNPMQQPAWSYSTSLVIVLAFCGRLETKNGRRALAGFSPSQREFWTATNELAAGQTDRAVRRLENLRAATADRLLLSEIEQRLDRAGIVGAGHLSRPSYALLHRLEHVSRPPASAFGSELKRPTVAVTIFIVLNVAMFVAEVKLGGSTSPVTLSRLGALEPGPVRYGHEYWRMLTALFLHYGPLHLIFNLYALFVIGPGLERAIGSIRFAIFYLLAGLGSSAGVLLLRFANFSPPEQMVGASGCVMGVVGIWAGYLFRHRHEPFAGRRLRNIVLIVGIQTAFDLSTPQISMAAHLSG